MKAFYYLILFLIMLFLLEAWNSSDKENLRLAVITLLKWLCLALSSIAFFVMTKPFELLSALRSLRFPEEIVFSLGMGFRFLPIIFESTERILMAQKARGLYSGKGLKKFFRIPIIIDALAVPLLIDILNRLWSMWLTLMIRGLNIERRHKRLRFTLSAPNIIVLVYSLSIFAACFVIRF
jgi:energy-coupling factor transport system permease protein